MRTVCITQPLVYKIIHIDFYACVCLRADMSGGLFTERRGVVLSGRWGSGDFYFFFSIDLIS